MFDKHIYEGNTCKTNIIVPDKITVEHNHRHEQSIYDRVEFTLNHLPANSSELWNHELSKLFYDIISIVDEYMVKHFNNEGTVILTHKVQDQHDIMVLRNPQIRQELVLSLQLWIAEAFNIDVMIRDPSFSLDNSDITILIRGRGCKQYNGNCRVIN